MDAAVQCKMCRICMKSDSKTMMIGLFEHNVQTQSLAKVVSLVGAVEVQQDDELPKLCCTQCFREVEVAYKLRILCQESDAKLRSHVPNKTATVKRGAFSDAKIKLQDPEGLASSDEALVQSQVDTLHTLSHTPNKAAVVKQEPFSDYESNSQDPESFAGNDDFFAQKEVMKLNAFTLDTIKHEYEEITIEDTCITDVNYCEPDQRTKRKAILEANNSINKPRRIFYTKLPKILDKYPAVKLSCCGCISSFDTIEELRAHGREEHRNTDSECFTLKERQCDICFEILHNGRTYDFHKKNVMYNYKCTLCGQILITLKQAITHCRLLHSAAQRNLTAEQALICCECKMHFSSAESLRNHSKTIHLPKKPPPDETKPFTCNICYRNYTTANVLRKHKLSYKKQSKKYVCKECNKLYGSASALKYHEQSHPQEYKKSFCSKRVIDQQVQNHATIRPFSCPQCPATFKRNSHLATHLPTHDVQEEYPCSQCDRHFKTNNGRIGHIRACHDATFCANDV